jgi:hypothetical protein
MSANQFRRHHNAKRQLDEVFRSPDKVLAIHYSCESFYNLPDGRSSRVTSIAIRNLQSGQTESFSIHQIAEIRRMPLNSAEIEEYYNDLEKDMLDAFNQYLGQHTGYHWLHWNMRDKNYGFQAIAHRHKVLGGDPIIVQDDRKIDLSRLLIDLYGVGYIAHPRLEKLLERNHITAKDFMTGKQEADAFEQKRYVDLHRSTLRKVDILCNIAQRAHDGTLKTNASWKEAQGVSWEAVLHIVRSHPIYAALSVVSTIGGVVGLAVLF